MVSVLAAFVGARLEVQTTNCNTSIKGSDRKLVEIARHEGGAAGLTEIGRMSFEY